MSRAQPRFHRTNPPLPVVGNSQGVVKYSIRGKLDQQLTITTFMFLGPNNAPTGAQLTTLLTNIQAAVFPKYGLCVSSDWGGGNLETLDVVHRNDIGGVVSGANGGATGNRAAGHMPSEVAAQVIRYTTTKGQHGRGRYSLPGIATADVTGSSISAATLLTAIGNLNTALLGNFSDGTNIWVHCIGQRSTISPKLVVNAQPVNRFVIPTLLGTIRRRKVGRGK